MCFEASPLWENTEDRRAGKQRERDSVREGVQACRSQPAHGEVAEPVVTAVQVAKPPPKDDADEEEGGGGAVIIVVVVLVVLAVVGLVVWKFVRRPCPRPCPRSLPR